MKSTSFAWDPPSKAEINAEHFLSLSYETHLLSLLVYASHTKSHRFRNFN